MLSKVNEAFYLKDFKFKEKEKGIVTYFSFIEVFNGSDDIKDICNVIG